VDRPKIKNNQWIKIGKSEGLVLSIDGYVIDTYSDGALSVGYYQNSLKAVKKDVIWNGDHWVFCPSDLGASYLRDAEELIVRRGPQC